jgi:ABC-type antimicrobial peptide transport system permease subunit
VLRGIFSRAAVLVGSGVVAGNFPGLFVAAFGLGRPRWLDIVVPSALMMTAGFLACIGPARRALRIHPTDALRET